MKAICMIEFAEWGSRRELTELWTQCFHDPVRYPRYFLNNYFVPHDCLVYRTGGRIGAALYMLPCRILTETGTLQAHYVFAAATLPEYRSRGYMSSLLAYAAIAGTERGDRFSVVLPSGDSLYGFYEKAGYTDLFQLRMLTVTNEELQNLAGHGAAACVLPESARLNALRIDCLAGQYGSVLWDNRMFHFAIGISQVYGDRLVCITKGYSDAYALCREENGSCTVLELMTDDTMFPYLAEAILREVPSGSYQFRLPAASGPFQGKGKIVRFGMAKPIGGTLPDDVRTSCPYLGLTLD